MGVSTGLNVLYKSEALHPTANIFLVICNKTCPLFLPQTPRYQVEIANLGMASSSTAPDPPTAPGPSEEPVGESSQPSQQSFPTFQTLPEYFTDWEIINEPREFYDERDCLDPSHNFASETLSNRSKDDVAIFDYSLNPEYLGHEEDGASSPPFGADGDIFLRVSRDEFIKSERFDELINRPGRDRLLQSRGPRLGIM